MVDQVDGVEVRLGTDASDAKSGIQDFQSAASSSLDKISGSLKSLTATSQSAHRDIQTHNAATESSFIKLHESIKNGFTVSGNIIERFKGQIGGLVALLAGGALFKGSIDALLNLESNVRSLAIVFGITAEKATLLDVNLKLAGVSAETFEQMAQRVGRVLRTQSEEFDRLKVVTKDANGNLLPMQTILQNIYQRMLDFKAGTDQTEFALSTVGRNAKDFASDMERISATTQRATELQHQLGIEMGPERIAQVERYRVEFNAFKIALDEIGVKIGESTLPRLEALAEWFNSVGPTALKYSVIAVQAFITALEAMGALIASILALGTTAYERFAESVRVRNEAMKAAFQGNWSEAYKIVADAAEKMRASNKQSADDIVSIWDAATARVNKMWAGIGGGSRFGMGDRGVGQDGALPGKGTERFTPKPVGGASQVSGYEAILKQAESAYNNLKLQQGSFEVWSESMTRDYWEEVLGFAKLGTKERQEITNKYYDSERRVQQAAFAAEIASLRTQEAEQGHNIEAKIALAQKEYEDTLQRYGQIDAKTQEAYKHLVELRQQLAAQRERIAEIEQKTEEATTKHSIEMNKLAADQAVALGQINAAQRLSIEKAYIDQEYQAELDGMSKRIALMAADPTADPVKLAELRAAMLKVEQDYQTKLTQIANAAELEREKYAIQAQDAIRSSMAQTLAQLVSNAKSWKDTLLAGLKALDDQLVKIASNKLVEQYFGAGTSGGDFISKLTGGIFGGGTSPQAIATTANTTALGLLTAAVTANTAAQGASAFTGGGGFGAGDIFGGGSGIFGDLLSFDTGSPFVPRDMVAVVHKGEAIIPAAYNNASAAGGMINMRNTFMFNGPVDTRTQTQMALQMQRVADKAMRRSR